MVVVITGPESSGKSTLHELLAQEYSCDRISEYAREYLNSSSYTFQELEHIAQTQLKKISEAKLKTHADELVLADTGNLVLEVWFEEVFNQLPEGWTEHIKTAIPDLYLLCAPDIPWEKDELRENPSDRQRLFEIYQQKLADRGIEYVVLRGDLESRIAKAKKSIAKKKAAL